MGDWRRESACIRPRRSRIKPLRDGHPSTTMAAPSGLRPVPAAAQREDDQHDIEGHRVHVQAGDADAEQADRDDPERLAERDRPDARPRQGPPTSAQADARPVGTAARRTPRRPSASDDMLIPAPATVIVRAAKRGQVGEGRDRRARAPGEGKDRAEGGKGTKPKVRSPSAPRSKRDDPARDRQGQAERQRTGQAGARRAGIPARCRSPASSR